MEWLQKDLQNVSPPNLDHLVSQSSKDVVFGEDAVAFAVVLCLLHYGCRRRPSVYRVIVCCEVSLQTSNRL